MPITSNSSDNFIQVDDILQIKIKAIDFNIIDPSVQFNPTNESSSVNSIDLLKINGYQVDNNGYISYPKLGLVYLLGLSLFEAEKLIYNKFLESELLINHEVSIRILNNRFTILGEVQSPGNYTYFENNFNIFNAIGYAGDLTINGVRNNIKLIRTINKERKVFTLDITSSSILESELYYVKTGDIIIINPNKTRIKNAGIIGNSGTLLSLLSFILSSIIITNN